jgi:hypothetical protein
LTSIVPSAAERKGQQLNFADATDIEVDIGRRREIALAGLA